MRLPNAPLVEVVFELRWQVQRPNAAEPFGYDPGYHVFSDKFQQLAAEAGYTIHENVEQTPFPVAHRVVEQFMTDRSEPFPLLQIGHGILACNMGPEYDWETFKKFVDQGVECVCDAYPQSNKANLNPTHIELRYIDAFDQTLLGHSSVEKFLVDHTNFQYGGLKFLNSEHFEENGKGRIRVCRTVAQDSETIFDVDIGNGRSGEQDAILVTNRVVKSGYSINIGYAKSDIKDAIHKWLEKNHHLTRMFFKEFVTDDLMKAFQNPPAESE